MDFFPKALAFFLEITDIYQKSQDSWFIEIFKIHRKVWIFIRIFILVCFVSITSKFKFDCTKIHFIK
jgi:hypothetical protein